MRRHHQALVTVLAESRAFSPEQISGLKLWTAARLLPVVADGSSIPTLTDFSGTNNQTTNADPAQRAKYYAGVLNGQPVARFVSADLSHYFFPNPVVGPLTAFFVAKQTEATSKYLFTTGNGGSGVRVLSTGFWYVLLNSSISSTYKIDSAFRICAIVARAYNDVDMLTDGAVVNTVGGTSWASAGAGIGGYGGTSDFFGGDLAELILYNRALTSTEIANVGAYLAAIYSLPFA